MEKNDKNMGYFLLYFQVFSFSIEGGDFWNLQDWSYCMHTQYMNYFQLSSPIGLIKNPS